MQPPQCAAPLKSPVEKTRFIPRRLAIPGPSLLAIFLPLDARPDVTANNSKSLPAIGFLTVVEDAQLGLLGGYLVLNTAGRPLEFHCTAPVKANRAQEILYGPTLAPYLYGEQIGQALISSARIQPQLVCTDLEPVLAVRDIVSLPVALVCSEVTGTSEASSIRQTEAARPQLSVVPPSSGPSAPSAKGALRFTLGQFQLAVPATHADDRARIIRDWQAHGEDFDLLEPFTRIREAIQEAQRGAA